MFPDKNINLNPKNLNSLFNIYSDKENTTQKKSKESIVATKKGIQLSKIPKIQIINHLAIQYKLTSQYGPSLGIYVLPKIEDFFTWNFYIFLRQGYYKDAKLQGSIYFDSQKEGQIKQIIFQTTAYHPFVKFQNGKVDLSRIVIEEQKKSNIFLILYRLKQMFLINEFFLVNDSLNSDCSKTYKKSQVLFIQKVFQTTVIPSTLNFLQYDSNQSDINRAQRKSLQEEQSIQLMKQKLKDICKKQFTSQPNSLLSNDCETQDTIQQKASKYLSILFSIK